MNFFYRLKFRFFQKKYLIAMRRRKEVKHNIRIMKSEILSINYNFKNFFIQNMFKNFPINFEIFFRQYNFYKFIRTEKFNFHLLQNKKIIYPLTNEQIKILKKNNYLINNFFSKLALINNCLIEIVKGIVIFLLILNKSILNLILLKKFNEQYIYIKNLTNNQIISMDKYNKNFKLFIEKKFNLSNLKLVHDNSNCKKKYFFNKFLLPQLCSFTEIYKFLYFFFKFNILILMDLLFLRYSQILIYSELVKLCCSLSKKKEDLENSYFFFNTSAFFRPLYSYGLGRNVFFFETSSHNLNIYYSKKENPIPFIMRNLTWENYILWYEKDKKEIQKNQIIKAKYYITGPILFGPSQNFSKDNVLSDSILVLDSVPYRNTFLSTYNHYHYNYTDVNAIKFLDDISKIEKNGNLYIKLKRNFNRLYHSKKYIKYISKSKYNLIESKNDTEEVINKFDRIICQPFSSTAFIAKELNKKVCFYDVCGIHNDFDSYIKDIPIIREFSELEKWCKI
jgi:polysaccharide biosynthesis PFTS motif protein